MSTDVKYADARESLAGKLVQEGGEEGEAQEEEEEEEEAKYSWFLFKSGKSAEKIRK